LVGGGGLGERRGEVFEFVISIVLLVAMMLCLKGEPNGLVIRPVKSRLVRTQECPKGGSREKTGGGKK